MTLLRGGSSDAALRMRLVWGVSPTTPIDRRDYPRQGGAGSPRVHPRSTALGFCLKLKHYELLSNFGFDFNLRPYTAEDQPHGARRHRQGGAG